jgi:hypothetical protein
MYALSFTYEFEKQKDATYFSYSYPYTYTQLDRLLFKLEEENQSILRRRTIGESLGSIFFII